jgi:2-polyprenyl-6-hydroxyphenyl methylase/3-demethylubiquinone-9 3-methyltransferase
MIWLLEYVLREIPLGVHDWKKFIRPAELKQVMHSNNFTQIEIKGFDLFGNSLYQNIFAYLFIREPEAFNLKSLTMIH